MNQEYYRRLQWIASLCIAVFIVHFALCMLVMNRSVYKHTKADYAQTGTVAISKAEAELYYEQVADSFSSFFKGDYEIAGYSLTETNKKQLNTLKGYYRLAWIVSIVSFGCGAYCIGKLWRRRETMPLLYGSAGGALLTSIFALRIVLSDKPVLGGIRNMIFRGDYSFFSEGDLLRDILPAAFARNLAFYYLGIVTIEILCFVLLRMVIRFSGRPHKY